MKLLLVSSGEPAGIGPDLCVGLAAYNLPLVILGDPEVLRDRAFHLDQNISIKEYQPGELITPELGCLTVYPISCASSVVCGQLNPQNSSYVIELLTHGAQLCAQGDFSALITAPVHKANINAAGIAFTGHTEFLADYFNVDDVVMMLACEQMRVALMTTHLPLRHVPDAINTDLVIKVISQLHQTLIKDFAIKNPIIKVAGLNPHAGESGYLGREELDVIAPALEHLKKQGILLEGPLPADTMFTEDSLNCCDAYVVMYHDQGLPVLKHVGFNQAVNVTLGLPIIRTSVDHGTALELAGTKKVNSGSMLAAVNMAMTMLQSRETYGNC